MSDDPLTVCCRHLAESQHILNDKDALIKETAWAAYQACNYAYMLYLSTPLRNGEEHCVSPTNVHLPKNIEDALDIAIRAFKPDQPSMREGNNLFGQTAVIFDAERFKFEP